MSAGDEWGDDAASYVPVDVTTPEGVTYPAVLTGGGFSKAGVVSFYVDPADAPEGEADGPRCEAFREILPLGRRIYRVERRGGTR